MKKKKTQVRIEYFFFFFFFFYIRQNYKSLEKQDLRTRRIKYFYDSRERCVFHVHSLSSKVTNIISRKLEKHVYM